MPAKTKQMDDRELLSVLIAEEQDAVGYYDSEIANEQADALERYYGRPYGDEEEGHSQVVSRDVAEVVDWTIPSLMRMFVGNDEAVVFEPRGPEGKPMAQQATALINQQFYTENDGFRILHDWAQDGLIQKVGFTKLWWDAEPRKSRHMYNGVTEEELVLLREQGADIAEATENDDGTFDIAMLTEMDYGRVCIDNVPPEEILIPRKCKRIDKTDYIAHRTTQPRADLIAMGYDETVVMGLPSSEGDEDFDQRAEERYDDENGLGSEMIRTDKLMQSVSVIEEYIRIDYNGDGVPEFRKVVRSGKEILDNQEVDFHPFEDFCPVPMAHKVYGRSQADVVMDIQRVNTNLLRQTLDNLYQSNNPRMSVPNRALDAGGNTINDLLNNVPGAIIRHDGQPGDIAPIAVPFTAGPSLQMLEMMLARREQRTGITRYNQGLDADSLNKTAAGTNMIMEASRDRLDFIARCLGNALAQLFRKMLKLNVAYNKLPTVVDIGGQWVEVDPAKLDPEMVVRPNVGLGTGNKDKRLQYRMTVLGLQQQALEIGMAGPKELWNNADGMIRDMGLGAPTDYFIPPEQIQAPKQQEDPSVTKARIDAEAKVASDKYKADVDAQVKMRGQDMEYQLSMQRLGVETITESVNGSVRMGGKIG